MADELEKLKKDLEKANKALSDTKAAYTKGQQALAATKAELVVLEDAGVKIPKEITALKTDDPEKYATELEKYNSKLTKLRQEKADAAKTEYTATALSEVAKAAGISVDDIQKHVPPIIYAGFTEGKLAAEHLVALAVQHKTGKTVVDSPTIQKEFDFSTVTGGLPGDTTPEIDKTLNERDYII